jgi:hypothetical protein
LPSRRAAVICDVGGLGDMPAGDTLAERVATVVRWAGERYHRAD